MTDVSGINLMLFNIAKFGIGFDARQILSLEPYNNETDDAIPIHKLLNLPRELSDYSNPRLMSLRNNHRTKILIDEPYDVVHVFQSEISPLPRIMKTKVAGCGLWGLFFTQGFLYSLYDVRLLIS